MWASHVETELRRLEADSGRREPCVMALASARGVRIFGPGDPGETIVRPGSLALTALVQLPDGAGVDAVWGALSSIPDVDATVERLSAEEASSREFPSAVIEAARVRLARGGIAEAVAPAAEAPAPGAMRPETRRRIEEAVRAMPLSALPAPVGACLMLARSALDIATVSRSESEKSQCILRAIAYLVRRLELDAPKGGT